MKMDARRLVHHFGGQAELQRKLEAAGHHITKDGIEKWCIRGNIPTEWHLRLLEIESFNISDFKLKPQKKVKRKDLDKHKPYCEERA